jgi:hypothetical protein
VVVVDEGRRFRQVAENERLLREANEEIEREVREEQRERAVGRDEMEVEFFCACGRADCEETLLLTLAEYEAAHTIPGHFIVAQGHEHADIERIVEEHDAYLVVEKHPSYAARGGSDAAASPQSPPEVHAPRH